MAKIGITMGDCAGIGPEITLKALASKADWGGHEFILYGDRPVYEEIASLAGLDASVLDRVEFVDLGLVHGPVEFGSIRADYGKAAGDYIEAATLDALAGKVGAIVTAPIHKKSFQLGGWGQRFPGHTEMLANLTGTKSYSMMLAYKNLRVLHVTTHVPLSQAVKDMTVERIVETIALGHDTCRRLGIKDIRVGVAGINPHAGDEGLFGSDEQERVVPAVAQANRMLDCTVEGPIPADTIFSKALGGMYDVVIAMYHDQGHIPIKTLGFRYDHAKGEWTEVTGINVTLGLPVLRTSVDHGTAFGKAGKGTANEESMLDAVEYALLLAK